MFHSCFNPRRDLFLFATAPVRHQIVSTYMFQSQAGFVPLCDVSAMKIKTPVIQVSIPGGICSSLRQSIPTLLVAYQIRFNPRRDLFLFATSCGTVRSTRSTPFQSQAGFVPLCDTTGDHDFSLRGLVFQSQAGFVPLCDGPLRRATGRPALVSIPGGICSSLRRKLVLMGISDQKGFNPRRDLFLFATIC